MYKKLIIFALSLGFLNGCQPARYTIPTVHMEPTIKKGETVIVNEHFYEIRSLDRWDIIAFKYWRDTNQVFIMRVIGLPNETINFEKNDISINGKKLALFGPYLTGKSFTNDIYNLGYAYSKNYTVSSNGFYVIGDNYSLSADSRTWREVPRELIIGKVISHK